MTKERKNVTWRVSEHPEHKKLNKWLDNQQNIQNSLSNIILHMIDRYGFVNITDYDVQKLLYGKFTDIDYRMEKDLDKKIESDESTINELVSNKEKSVTDKPSEEKKEKNDLYSGIDINNL